MISICKPQKGNFYTDTKLAIYSMLPINKKTGIHWNKKRPGWVLTGPGPKGTSNKIKTRSRTK